MIKKPKPSKDDFHLLDRAEQSILVRLRTGHNRLNAHMHRKLKLSPSPKCSRGIEDQTAEHILQRCPLFEQKRKDLWHEDIPMERKLYGNVEDLRRTTAFIVVTGMTV